MRHIVRVEVFFEAADSKAASKLVKELREHYAKFGDTIAKVNGAKFCGASSEVVEVARKEN